MKFPARLCRGMVLAAIMWLCIVPFHICYAQTPTTQPHKVDLPGTLEAFEQTDLCAKVSGYLSEVRVDIGDHVKTGDLLANIDVPELQNDLTEAISLHAAREKSLEAALEQCATVRAGAAHAALPSTPR